MDDTDLVEALRGGDREAFRRIVTDLNPGLTRMARSYVPEALADEVVQETWLAVIGSLDRFEGRSSLKTWIYRIMLNKVRRLASRESKVVPFASAGPRSDPDQPAVAIDRLVHDDLGVGYWPEAPPRWDTRPAERLESAEVMKVIGEEIASLPPAQREVILLRDIEGWSAAEVCDALGISSVNQRVQLHRARTTVRNRLEEYLV